ncbi:MAG TPA: hypothetical protein VNT54_03765 [Solirubrobacteraceae bacterium]|nr:hypothetical protein [Solirubrobacteraceae bacterium]
MSRSAAARADHDHAVRPSRGSHAPSITRRVSGPMNGSQARMAVSDAAPAFRPRIPASPPLRLAAGGASIVLRVADTALHVSGSRTMDRLVRSRGWVLIVGFALIGIVAMQVSMLKLNSAIGRSVETAATLERGNATLRGEISRLSSGDRIQALAGTRGFVMPEPADVTYLRARDLRADGARAAEAMRSPDRGIAGPAGSATAEAPAALTGAPPAAETPVGAAPAAAPAGTAALAETAPATAARTAPPATATGAPATAPAAQPPAATAAAVPPVTPSGGVTVP